MGPTGCRAWSGSFAVPAWCKRVRRLMGRHNMAGRAYRRRVTTTVAGPDGYKIPDLVGRGFEPGAAPEMIERNGAGSGMGLMIIRVLTDELEISATGSGTLLTLVKRFSAESS